MIGPLVPPQAQRVGTVNAIDRSRQYTRADNSELLRSLNEAWAKIRLVEQDNRKKDIAIGMLHGKMARYRGGLVVLTSIITGLAWEGLKFVLPMLLRYLGLT